MYSQNCSSVCVPHLLLPQLSHLLRNLGITLTPRSCHQTWAPHVPPSLSYHWLSHGLTLVQSPCFHDLPDPLYRCNLTLRDQFNRIKAEPPINSSALLLSAHLKPRKWNSHDLSRGKRDIDAKILLSLSIHCISSRSSLPTLSSLRRRCRVVYHVTQASHFSQGFERSFCCLKLRR